jgi:GT2 family glycosyltransferase
VRLLARPAATSASEASFYSVSADAVPALSVVIPVLNGARVLPEQLASLAEQTVDLGVEVLVADNGSTDQTVAVAQSFAGQLDLRVIDASAARGQTYARNTGARHARAGQMLFLDQDDVVAPGYLAAMSAALEHNEFVAAAVDTRSLNPGWRAQVRSLAQERELPRDVLPWAYGCTLGVTRRAFDLVGGFDTTLYSAAEDIDFCWRLHLAGVELHFVPDAVVQYRFPDTCRKLLAQGRRYGVGQAAVNRKHRVLGVRRLAFRAWLRHVLGALRLVLLGRNRGERGRGCFLLGRRLGMIEGSLRLRARSSLL